MWQRIQTVFLAIVIVALVLSLIQPIWIFKVEGETSIMLTPFFYLNDASYTYLPFSLTAILSIASITVAFTSIRKYKNRLLQMKLGALNSLLLVGVIGSSVYFAVHLVEQFQGGRYGFGLYLPLAAVISNLLANFFIRRDEKLVRDSERLR